MNIRSVIVDDDEFSRQELTRLLRMHLSLEVTIVAEFSNASEAISYIKLHKPDLVFLDIQMPGISGFEMLDHLDTNSFEVIFITSHDEYAIRAIKYSALDYLLKPIDPVELKSAINRFTQSTQNNLSRLKISNLQFNLNSESHDKFQLIIPTKQGEHQFVANEIIRCEADSNYTAIHFGQSRKFLASKTLSDIESMLNTAKNFLRIHKSHLINLNHVVQLTSTDELLMGDQTRVPISRRRLAEVKEVIRSMKRN